MIRSWDRGQINKRSLTFFTGAQIFKLVRFQRKWLKLIGSPRWFRKGIVLHISRKLGSMWIKGSKVNAHIWSMAMNFDPPLTKMGTFKVYKTIHFLNLHGNLINLSPFSVGVLSTSPIKCIWFRSIRSNFKFWWPSLVIMSTKHTQQIERIQKRACHIILGSTYTSYAEVLSSTGLQPWKRDTNISAVNLLISAQLQRNTLGGSLSTIVPIAWACITPVLTRSVWEQCYPPSYQISELISVFLHFLGGGGRRKTGAFLGSVAVFCVPMCNKCFVFFFTVCN